MKIILSRKGFDSASGGCPSPVLPDGRAYALQIPDKQSAIRYSDIHYKSYNIGDIVFKLTKGKVKPDYFAHLDPDLERDSYIRQEGWQPIFGQAGASQGHLRRMNISPGDIFLFFGLFRKTVEKLGKLEWASGSRPFHAFWGWLQVGKIVSVTDSTTNEIPWAAYHPHLAYAERQNNSLYLANDKLIIDGKPVLNAGAGVFNKLKTEHILTMDGSKNTTNWHLPLWFYPSAGKKPLSYHEDLYRWQKNENECLLKLVARGQEFVLDGNDYPESIDWAKNLICGSEK